MDGPGRRLRNASVLVAAVLTAAACSHDPVAEPVSPTTTTAVTAAPSDTRPSGVTTSPTPTTVSTEPAVVVSRGNPSRRMVALTFDAGSDTGFAAQILDTLAAHGVTATFGLTGAWAEANPDLVARIAAAGHALINHTYDHRSFTGVSARPAVTSSAERRDQLERTEAAVRRLTGGTTTRPWFRPPYGDYDRSVNADVGALGYRYNVLWSVDSLGWQGLSTDAITARCLRGAEPGAIYLFHVGAASRDAAALPAIIAGLRAEGYGFGTVAEVVPD